jgi:hypothetical protein
MTKSLFIGLAAAVALCGCHRSTTNAANASTVKDTGGTPVTLVGCLVPGGPAAQTGAVGTSGNTAPVTFTLVDVTTTSTPSSDTGAAASGVSGTSGASGTPPVPGTPIVDTGTPRSYSLVGDRKQDDLKKYQNSKVEVTGVLFASTDTGNGVPDVGAASAPAGAPPTDVQRVRVDNVRQLDKNCSGTSSQK